MTALRCGTTTASIADETVDYGHGDAEASRFIRALADALAVDGDARHSGLRGRLALPLAERRLPVNVDPLKSDLKNEEERARLARVFEQGLDRIVGYVLPVRRGPETRALDERTLVPAIRAPVPHSRRFADRLPVAARLPALGGQ